MKILLKIILFIILISCDLNNEEQFKGIWVIVEFKITETDYTNQLYENNIIFDDKNDVFVPETKDFNRNQKSYWEIVNHRLIIGTENVLFNDEYKYSYKNNSTDIVLYLTSDNKTIKLKKIY